MSVELVRGQNHPLPDTRLEIRVAADVPVVAGVLLAGADGRVTGPDRIAHPGSPRLPGVEVPRQAAARHRLAVDLGAVPDAVHQAAVVLALPAGAGPDRFGTVAAPCTAVTGTDGSEIAGFTLTGLAGESAVVALELYRRQGSWKVRAVGQGYAGGLAALLHDQGVPDADGLARDIQEAVGRGMGRTAAPPPPRTPDAARVRQGAAGPHAAPRGPSPEAPPPHSADTQHPAPPPGPHPATPGGPLPPTGHHPGRHPAPPAGPRAAPVGGAPAQPPSHPGTAPGGGTAAGGAGRIDYTHPGRRRSTAPPPAAPPPPPPAAPPAQPAAPVAGDAAGWSMDERLYNQVWGMFEDLARATAAYRSAVDFAETRREQELDRALADPRNRVGAGGDAARAAARARCQELTDRAREALDRDLDRLAAESDVVEPALPPAFAGWDNPVWHAYRAPTEIPMAVRLGDLHLPERPELRIPLLVRLPLERGLWIDCGRRGSEEALLADGARLRRLALDTAVAHAARLLAVYPPDEFAVHVIDPAGAAAAALAPLTAAGVLAAPPAAGAAGVAAALSRLTRRVDLVQMAVRAGAGTDALPPDLDTGEQLLIVNDFPHGFDDRAVNQLRYLADEGPPVGVHLLLVADREDARAYGPVLDPLWRSLLRLTPVAGDHLADPWVGHAWTYEPARVPPGSEVLGHVLRHAAGKRRGRGR
ncbi:TerD family protein [Streptomyces sp. CC228A]|uniref:TerD family protein n=1 Tax=Streptomyces sp. CC228A TaxID=2898186 RepID=UPI001F34DEF6|nr:TerD family protein [Streptomyces sp. CC228A]